MLFTSFYSVLLRCLTSTGKVMAGCLVSQVPQWNIHSAAALGPAPLWPCPPLRPVQSVCAQQPLMFLGSVGHSYVVVARQ